MVNLIAIIRSIRIRRQEALLAKNQAAAIEAESTTKKESGAEKSQNPNLVEMVAHSVNRKDKSNVNQLDEIEEEDEEL